MPQKRVIAHFMYEEEGEAARRAIRPVQSTESFIVGDVDEEEIGPLRDRGLLVVELEQPPQEEAAPGPGAGAFSLGAAYGAADPAPTEPSGYYLLRVAGPLQDAWRRKVEEHGGKLVRYVPQQQYLFWLDGAQVQAVRGLEFVSAVREYGYDDTPLVRCSEPWGEAPPDAPGETSAGDAGAGSDEGGYASADDAGALEAAAGGDRFGLAPGAAEPERGAAPAPEALFDAMVHEPEGRPRLEAWLAERDVPVEAAGKWKVRVRVPSDSPLLEELRNHGDVESVIEYVPPTACNEVARVALRLDREGPPPQPRLALTGAGQVVAVADTGLDTTHPDFPPERLQRVIPRGRPDRADDPDGHGTHVAGSVCAVAPGATLVFQSLLGDEGGLGAGLPAELGGLFAEAYAEGARIHNLSWGSPASSHYGPHSMEVDEFVREHPDMLVVIAAGNDGRAAPPSPRVQQGFVDWLSLRAPATAKNALTVGACRSPRAAGGWAAFDYRTKFPGQFPDPRIAAERVSGDPECIAAFSSRGPCVDLRIKPDLVAPGTDILSARSALAPEGNFWATDPARPGYAYLGGTSMAAPLAAGCAALVREFYASGGAGEAHPPSAALLKATLVNGTRWLSGWDATAEHPAAPNYHQGFGCIDMAATLPNPDAPGMELRFVDAWRDGSLRLRATGSAFRFRIAVESSEVPLRICLAYTDLPRSGRQNHVNIRVEHQPTRQRWEGNPTLPANPLQLPDPFNNLQVVRLERPATGGYLIQVAAGESLPEPQDFALVVTGAFGGKPLAKL